MFSVFKGVKNVRVGYIGGESDFLMYLVVCVGGIGYMEGYYVAYDAATTSFDKLLE